MTRTILMLITSGAFLAVAVAVGAGPGCAPGGVGDPCIPDEEYDTCFAGFASTEVNTESRSFQCQTRLCLVNHFQGRVSCPYGQVAGGDGGVAGGDSGCPGVAGGPPYTPCGPSNPAAPEGTQSCPGQPLCTIPGGATVLGGASAAVQNEYQIKVTVPAQLVERNTAHAVYCSCRCANSEGQTNDGQVYCQCPDGFTCAQQLVTSISADNALLAGGYCIKNGTAFTTQSSMTGCNPSDPTTVCP